MLTQEQAIVVVYTFLPGIALSWAAKRYSPWEWLYNLFRLPSTVAHELCHYLGIFIGGKPVSFDVFPKRNPSGGYTLGSVQFVGLNWLNSFFIGMAPVLILVALYYLAPQQGSPLNSYLLYWLIVGIFYAGGIPSKQDFKIALINGWPVFVATVSCLYFWVLYF